LFAQESGGNLGLTMKLNEAEIRDLMVRRAKFTIVVDSGDRIKVRSHDHIFIPPLEDERGEQIPDDNRSDFFQVWADGRHYRMVAFNSISIIEPDGVTGEDESVTP
jgi:hypothetical protein